ESSSPVCSSCAVPPRASGTFRVPATALRNCFDSTRQSPTIRAESGRSPRPVKRVMPTATIATRPTRARRSSHQGCAKRSAMERGGGNEASGAESRAEAGAILRPGRQSRFAPAPIADDGGDRHLVVDRLPVVVPEDLHEAEEAGREAGGIATEALE